MWQEHLLGHEVFRALTTIFLAGLPVAYMILPQGASDLLHPFFLKKTRAKRIQKKRYASTSTIVFILDGAVNHRAQCCQPVAHSWNRTGTEHLTVSDQTQGLPAPPLEKAAPQDARTIPLPQPLDITVPRLDIRNAIEKRRSVRHYSRDLLTIEELAYLCWCTQGIVDVGHRLHASQCPFCRGATRFRDLSAHQPGQRYTTRAVTAYLSSPRSSHH